MFFNELCYAGLISQNLMDSFKFNELKLEKDAGFL